jgi:hypothetical protein
VGHTLWATGPAFRSKHGRHIHYISPRPPADFRPTLPGQCSVLMPIEMPTSVEQHAIHPIWLLALLEGGHVSSQCIPCVHNQASSMAHLS